MPDPPQPPITITLKPVKGHSAAYDHEVLSQSDPRLTGAARTSIQCVWGGPDLPLMFTIVEDPHAVYVNYWQWARLVHGAIISSNDPGRNEVKSIHVNPALSIVQIDYYSDDDNG